MISGKQFYPIILFTLVIGYAGLLFFRINAIQLFAADERLYAAAVQNLLNGSIGLDNHPLLAKTIWYFIVLSFYAVTGIDAPLFWRFGTIIFSFGSLLVFYRISRLLVPRRWALLGVILLATDPMFFSFSRLLMLDIPCLFFFLVFVYYFLRLLIYSNSQSNLWKSALFLGLSLATKMAALPVVGLAVAVIFFITKTFKQAIRKSFLFLMVMLFGFIVGNALYFFKAQPVAFYQYPISLITSQLTMVKNQGNHQTSPAYSWFTTPQILILYRLFSVDHRQVTTIVAFQHPLMFIMTIPLLLLIIIRLFFKKVSPRQAKILIFLILSLSSLYLPWFLAIHDTYYYYILPLIPIILLLFLSAVSSLQLNEVPKRLALTVFGGVYITIFLIYYPLLVGSNIKLTDEATLMKYAQWHFPPTNTLFCQLCSPLRYP
jgi:dolichyl-phosphate-mannose--protein O-mannosyl transferase